MKKLTKAGIGLAAVAAVSAASALAVFAWGSPRKTFTMENPADYITFNSITNNVIGDERYFVSASRWTGSNADNYFSDATEVEADKEYVVRMYVHNNMASDLPNNVAENVRAYVTLPTTTAKSITITGTVTSSNANPNKVWDETTLKSKNGEVFNLAYVPGTAKYMNTDDNKNVRYFSLSDSLFTNSGAALGYNQMDGKIPGCNKYSGYITFHVKAQFAKKTENPNVSIQKEVKLLGSDKWSEEVTAKAGETVRYRITAKNAGNTKLENFSVRDILPTGLTYVKGSTTVATAQYPKGTSVSDNIITDGGVNLGTFDANAVAYIYFNATVNSAVAEKCNNSLLRNVAQLTSSSINHTREDSADVFVQGKTCTEGFTLDKKVRIGSNDFAENITAKAGDKVEYRIQFKNTGNVDLKDVVIRDILPSNETYVKGSTNLDGKSLADGVITTDGVNIGTVGAGKTVNLYFFVTMNGSLADICEKVELTNTAKAKYNNDAKTEKSDTAVVSVDGKDCTDENPGFTINKMVQLKGGNEWAEDVTAKAGDTVRYRIQFKNIGNTTLKNVVIRDVLPAGMTYVKGSTVLYNAAHTGGKTLDDGIVSNDGINIGDYAKGTEATIYFYATVNTPADECKDSTLRNIAKGKYNNDAKTEKSDAADVTVNAKVCTTPESPELPKTGANTVISSVIGAASVATAAGYYIISRKKLN